MVTDQNIVLTGFMGVGKSVVSKELSARLKRERVSSDEWIEQKEGRSIKDIFRDKGENYFRALEKKAIEELSPRRNLIIDCGGGVVLRQENVDRLKKNGIIFCLTATPDVIYQRIKDQKDRPLLNVHDPRTKIAQLLKQREPYYNQADHTLDTSHLIPPATAEVILKLLTP